MIMTRALREKQLHNTAGRNFIVNKRLAVFHTVVPKWTWKVLPILQVQDMCISIFLTEQCNSQAPTKTGFNYPQTTSVV